ncbi:hypothetical protein [Pseudomonas sp. KCJK9016]|uniref:hypothetical protein n=1 Tax=Pseudomonas sp. KCJK9016 TaxID=3344556 RepID=UPI0039068FC6
MKKLKHWLTPLMLLGVSQAQGANQEIKALFQPDPSMPWKNEFINQTPNSGYCAIYPEQCSDNKTFSIQMPIRFHTITPMSLNEGVWIKAPAQWRSLTVTNPETQQTSTVEVRISGIGSVFRLSRPVTELTGIADILEAHRKLWTTSSWVNAPPPCQYSGVGAYTPSTYRFFWKTPQSGSCNKIAAFNVGHMSFEHLDVAYELRTPNPLAMSAGVYRGSLTYSVGRVAADFNMGPLFDSDDANLTLDFVLDVQHTLKVDLPPGGNRIALEPEGGWQPWLNTRRIPERLYRDQTFHISASSRFKMYLDCGGTATSEYCFLYNDNQSSYAAMGVSVTLPGGLTDTGGRPVRRQRLRPHEVNAVVFQPGIYVDRQQGTLHFDVEKNSIARILTADKGNKYSQTVIVVFDSEI